MLKANPANFLRSMRRAIKQIRRWREKPKPFSAGRLRREPELMGGTE